MKVFRIILFSLISIALFLIIMFSYENVMMVIEHKCIYDDNYYQNHTEKCETIWGSD